MPKNFIQDIKKIKKNLVEKRTEQVKIADIDAKFDSLYRPSRENQRDNNGSKYGLWFVALIAMVFLFFAVSFLFSGAKITVNPKTLDLSIDDSFVATKNSSADNLPFDLVVISGDDSKQVQGGEEKDTSENAKGTVILYNAFNTSAQNLDINTRLEGSNGKIYKTKTKITIPGISSSGTPGSVEVEIYASEGGEAYNSGPLDFTVFGFKGTAKYSKIYARSKGDITGGFKGKIRQVSEVEKINAINELKVSLKDKLLKKASDQIPGGYILFKDAIFVETDNGTVENASEDGMVSVKLEGTFYGFLFDEKKLTKRIVESNIEKYKDDDVFIPNLRNFNFVLNNRENVSFNDVNEINFNLSGTSKIVWNIDTEKLVGDVLGKNKKDFNQVLVQYPSIDSAEVIVKPVWRTTFPDKLNDIKVVVNYPQ